MATRNESRHSKNPIKINVIMNLRVPKDGMIVWSTIASEKFIVRETDLLNCGYFIKMDFVPKRYLKAYDTSISVMSWHSQINRGTLKIQ